MQDEKELQEIFIRTYGQPKEKRGAFESRKVSAGGNSGPSYRPVKKEQKQECLLVDGYNIIFSWEDLKDLAAVNMEGA